MLRSALFAAVLVIASGASAQPAPPEPVKTSVQAQGLVGDLYALPAAKGRRPAVIVLGGSEGGMGAGAARDARLLAAHGYVVLQLAYFDAPGLPKELGLIPLEYFKTAIAWLQAQPGVDPKRIGMQGTSVGGEVALVVASQAPEIKVVVAAVPSSVVWPGISRTNPEPPSTFSLAGQPLPYLPYGWNGPSTTIYQLYDLGLAHLDKHPDAVIPVERINGPVMLICGKQDMLWPSCPMSAQVAARLKAKGFRKPLKLHAYDEAGHAVFGPPLPADSPGIASLAELGGTPLGNQAARQENWPAAIAFMDTVLKP